MKFKTSCLVELIIKFLNFKSTTFIIKQNMKVFVIKVTESAKKNEVKVTLWIKSWNIFNFSEIPQKLVLVK